MTAPAPQEHPARWVSVSMWIHFDQDLDTLITRVASSHNGVQQPDANKTMVLEGLDPGYVYEVVKSGLLRALSEGWASVVEPF